MRRYAMVLAACAPVFLGAVSAAVAQPEVHCIVRIEADASVLPLSEEMINALVSSDPISGQPARDMVGAEALNTDAFEVTFRQIAPEHKNMFARGGSRQVMVGEIRVAIWDENSPLKADKLLDTVCERLTGALARTAEGVGVALRMQLEAIANDLEATHSEQAELRDRRQQLLDEAGRADLTRDRLEHEIAAYEEQKRMLRFEYESMIAREQSLTEQVAKIAETVEEKVAASEALREMQKALELRGERLEHAKTAYENGQMSHAELAEVEAQLAEQRVHLIRMREDVARQMGGNMLEDLNRNLIELGVNSAEQEAKLSAVESALARIREGKLMSLADRYEREVAAQLSSLERTVHALLDEQRELKTKLRVLQPPSVIVIGEQ